MSWSTAKPTKLQLHSDQPEQSVFAWRSSKKGTGGVFLPSPFSLFPSFSHSLSPFLSLRHLFALLPSAFLYSPSAFLSSPSPPPPHSLPLHPTSSSLLIVKECGQWKLWPDLSLRLHSFTVSYRTEPTYQHIAPKEDGKFYSGYDRHAVSCRERKFQDKAKHL